MAREQGRQCCSATLRCARLLETAAEVPDNGSGCCNTRCLQLSAAHLQRRQSSGRDATGGDSAPSPRHALQAAGAYRPQFSCLASFDASPSPHVQMFVCAFSGQTWQRDTAAQHLSAWLFPYPLAISGGPCCKPVDALALETEVPMNCRHLHSECNTMPMRRFTFACIHGRRSRCALACHYLLHPSWTLKSIKWRRAVAAVVERTPHDKCTRSGGAGRSSWLCARRALQSSQAASRPRQTSARQRRRANQRAGAANTQRPPDLAARTTTGGWGTPR